MPFQFTIPTSTGQLPISIEPGSSVIFVGANGGGKTRLAVHIESSFQLSAHRISAHRALNLNPGVPKIRESTALMGLKTGHAAEDSTYGNRVGSRWGNKLSVSMLNDFDFLIQALFGDQSNKSLETHNKVCKGECFTVEQTKFQRLAKIWERLLPHRHLHITGDDIKVSVDGSIVQYSASEMSDGERAIFYLIGQTFTAEKNSVLIIDEPELHVHRSIMDKLWDELEAARQDCGFVFITHDLLFAAARVAQKFVIREYDPAPSWTIDSVPENGGFDEELTTLILGSRRPVLFVEGCESSLDLIIYRSCFPTWTVIPRGSCENVIHSVVTMRKNNELTRVTCSGIVDADDRNLNEIEILLDLGIATLPVTEIENIILLPEVSRIIAENEAYTGNELQNRLDELKKAIFNTASLPDAMDAVIARYCRRRIDRQLKKIDFSSAKTVSEITNEYAEKTKSINISEIAQSVTSRIEEAIREGDLPKFLANWDNKGLMGLASKNLKGATRSDFKNWLSRILNNNQAPAILEAIRNKIPTIIPQ